MPTKTIYVADDALWKKAKKLAGKAGLSGVIVRALEELVARAERQKEGYEPYRFEVVDIMAGSEPVTEYVGFEGKKLLQGIFEPDHTPPPPPEMLCAGTEGVALGVYRTKAGTLIVVAGGDDWHEDRWTHLGKYGSLREVTKDLAIECLTTKARAQVIEALSKEIGEDLVTWID